MPLVYRSWYSSQTSFLSLRLPRLCSEVFVADHLVVRDGPEKPLLPRGGKVLAAQVLRVVRGRSQRVHKWGRP